MSWPRPYRILPLSGWEACSSGFALREISVGERLTAKVHPRGEQAFKPEELVLGDRRIPASAWQIHDVRVNGVSQLDGDELGGRLFPLDDRYARWAISSRLDTIGVGGDLEVDVSFQGSGDVSRASFCAALLGFEVEPQVDVTAYSGVVRFRTLGGELVAAACDGPSRVLPGEAAWFVARPTTSMFRIGHLVLDHHWWDWAIVDLQVDGRAQLSQAGDLPGDCFRPNAIDTFVGLDTVPPGRPFAIRARYLGSNPRGGRFGALVHGVVVPGEE
jgi:hypothetical protein